LAFDCWLFGSFQDVRGLVHPAALSARLRPHFLDRLPEAERAVGDRQLGRHRKSAPLQVEEQLASGRNGGSQLIESRRNYHSL
jgi:hypothetical protein